MDEKEIQDISLPSTGTFYFFTGLAGAGKTTLGGMFYQRLVAIHPDAVLIDGHQVREAAVSHGASRDYSNAARLAGAWGMFARCKRITEKGRDVVCCSMSLFKEIQDWNRGNIQNYKEIFIDVEMDILKQRRGELYSGEQKQVVGLDLPYHRPEHPDVVIHNTGEQTPEEIVDQLVKMLLEV